MNSSEGNHLTAPNVVIGHHCLARLPGSFVDLVAPLLGYEKIEFALHDGRLHHSANRTTAFTVDSNRQLIVPIGCRPRLIPTLRNAGCKIEVEDLRDMNRESRQLA